MGMTFAIGAFIMAALVASHVTVGLGVEGPVNKQSALFALRIGVARHDLGPLIFGTR
jgi:hypothetical protein